MPYYTNTVLTTSTATTTNNLIYDGSYYYSDPLYVQPQTFRYEPAYKVPPEILAEGAAIPENDMAWLKRRVSEISWVPA
jgi:hypothetical protein